MDCVVYLTWTLYRYLNNTIINRDRYRQPVYRYKTQDSKIFSSGFLSLHNSVNIPLLDRGQAQDLIGTSHPVPLISPRLPILTSKTDRQDSAHIPLSTFHRAWVRLQRPRPGILVWYNRPPPIPGRFYWGQRGFFPSPEYGQ